MSFLAGVNINSEDAAYFSILFDIGGIIGGIIAGLATDYTGKSATTCAVMLIGAIPAVRTFNEFLKANILLKSRNLLRKVWSSKYWVLYAITRNGQPFSQEDQTSDLKTWRDKKSSKKAYAGYNIHFKAF